MTRSDNDRFLQRARNLLTRWPAPKGAGAVFERVRSVCRYAAEGEDLDAHAARVAFVVERAKRAA